jgi:hypothetical protein
MVNLVLSLLQFKAGCNVQAMAYADDLLHSKHHCQDCMPRGSNHPC